MMVFFDTCKNSIRTIPVLQHDTDRPEDLNTEQEDHAADEVRYACMSRPYIATKKTVDKEKRFTDYVPPKGVAEPAGDWVAY